jgi:hypothetical protein
MAMAMRIGSTGQHSLPACAETWLKWEIAYRLYTPQPTPNVDDDEDDEDEDDGGGSGGGNIDPDDDEGWSDDEDDEDDETLWTAPPRGYPAATLYAIAAGTSCAVLPRSLFSMFCFNRPVGMACVRIAVGYLAARQDPAPFKSPVDPGILRPESPALTLEIRVAAEHPIAAVHTQRLRAIVEAGAV